MTDVDTVDVNTDHTRTHDASVAVGTTDQLGASMTRGWPYERKPIKAVDPIGRDVEVTVGFVHDNDGKLRLALGIGDGPTALLSVGFGLRATAIELMSQLHYAIGDLLKRGGS
ncbi:hypothetical protein [Amycolatopsis vancoresmycina]|uniref:hypothetical protein n=1 Tax=Amycolatopsis vancoresmycina TaxID=208444 RepID=UPI0012DD503B|nr:hypothetical protein [Amycolatopsis vancoresmycina]